MYFNPPKSRMAAGQYLDHAGRYVRHLGTSERLLFLYSNDHPRHFCVAAEITGELTPEDFRPAFDLVQRRHPMLNVEIRIDGQSGPAFYGVKRPIDGELKPLSHDGDWIAEVERELATPFPGAGGPLMRATILFQQQKTVIILTFHHAIADGPSAAFVIRDLMSALDGQHLETLPAIPAFEAILSALPIAVEFPTESLLSQNHADGLRAIAAEPLWRAFEDHLPKVSTLTLSKDLTEEIDRRAKANGTTVDGALCAALALSDIHSNSLEAYTVMTSIDARAILGLHKGECGLYGAASLVRVSGNDRKDFWTMAYRVTEDLATKGSAAGVLASSRGADAHVPSDASSALAKGIDGALRYQAALTHLGRLPIPETIGRLRLTGFWGPLVQRQFKHERVIGAAIVGERLHLVHTSPPYIPSILDAIGERLHEAVKMSL